MIAITHDQLPEDHYYYRTTSRAYREYCHKGMTFFDVGNQYGWMKQIIPGKFQVAKFEKMDTEPDIDRLRAAGFTHGMVIWVPWRRTSAPAGWRKLWIASHNTHSGISVLDRDDYWKKWNERGQRARKKFLAAPGVEIRTPSIEEFAEAFAKTKVRYWFKEVFISYFKKMMAIDPSSVRYWLCYRDGVPVAGLAVHDYENSSVHMVAFTQPGAKAVQGGTGLIDRWFSDSRARGIQYLDFDHLFEGSLTSRDQKGYSDFKKNFIDYFFTIKDSWFKLL